VALLLVLLATREGTNREVPAPNASDSAKPTALVAANPVPPSARATDRIDARFSVNPASASVSVNGIATQHASDGTVTLSGEPGSAFSVKAELDGRTAETKVVLLPDGRTDPVELRVPAPSARRGIARAKAPPVGTERASTTPSPPSSVVAAPPAELVPKDEF
jgi:hypothetical protein